MSDVVAWLAERLHDAPEPLRTRMEAAVASVMSEAPMHEQLAQAAQRCFARALRDSSHESALDLLAGDALLTHACEAAAEAGSATLAVFANAWSAEHFEQLLANPV
jgi:hypothetical protein